MELKNGYKVIYEKAANGERTFYASKSGTFTDAEQIGEAVEIGKYKLIYEKNGKIYCSESGVPAFNENGEPVDVTVEGFDKVFVKTEEPSGDSIMGGASAPIDPYTEAVSTNSDSHCTPIVEGNIVTFKVTEPIKWAKSAVGRYGNWVGFRLNVPEGIDAATVVYTRPNGKSSMLSEVLDSGKNYASVYYDMSKRKTKPATYTIDWNGDGVNDLTIVIDVSEADLEADPEATATV